MRIISGSLGGRRIHPPAKMPHTRPTTDLAKEGLFNILGNQLSIEGMKTLDLFGGTGSISYELFSRGATDLTVVENDHKMHDFIVQTAASLKCSVLKVVQRDVFKFIEQCPEKFDFIFAGPPYTLSTIDQLPVKIFERKLLRQDGWLILEHTPRNEYKTHPHFKTARNYGTTIFSIFVNDEKNKLKMEN